MRHRNLYRKLLDIHQEVEQISSACGMTPEFEQEYRRWRLELRDHLFSEVGLSLTEEELTTEAVLELMDAITEPAYTRLDAEIAALANFAGWSHPKLWRLIVEFPLPTCKAA